MRRIHGNDILVKDELFVISVYGTGEGIDREPKVFTNIGNDIYLFVYDPRNRNQVFRCTVDSNNRWGFVCVDSNKRLNRDQWQKLKCEKSEVGCGSWESFYFDNVQGGGYKMMMTINEKLCPLQIREDHDGEWLSLHPGKDAQGKDVLGKDARIGLTRSRANNLNSSCIIA